MKLSCIILKRESKKYSKTKVTLVFDKILHYAKKVLA